MKLASSAREAVVSMHPNAELDFLAKECEKQAILASLDNLLTFPWVKSRVESGALQLHGWYFDIEYGMLLAYKDGVFEPLNPEKRD
jgi:carbonic anhydrase